MEDYLPDTFGGCDSFTASDQTTVTNTLYGHMAMNTAQVLSQLHITDTGAAQGWKPMQRSSWCTAFVLMLMNKGG